MKNRPAWYPFVEGWFTPASALRGHRLGERQGLSGHQIDQAALKGCGKRLQMSARVASRPRAAAHLRELEPTLRISNLRDQIPYRRPEDLARFADGLRKAGLPE
jgi:hypothetical protein